MNLELIYAISDRLYAIGGHDGSDHLSSGEYYEPVTNTWKSIAKMNTSR